MMSSCIPSNALPNFFATSSAPTLFAGAALALLLGVSASTLPAHGSETPNALSVQAAVQPRSLSDGTYVYGQVAKAEQIGKTYLILQVRDRAVTGAIYQPSSSFDCFQGNLQTNRLALMITDNYGQTQSPYAIALQTNSRVATAENPPLEVVQLAGFHRLQTLSQNDRRLLSICKAKSPSLMKF